MHYRPLGFGLGGLGTSVPCPSGASVLTGKMGMVCIRYEHVYYIMLHTALHTVWVWAMLRFEYDFSASQCFILAVVWLSTLLLYTFHVCECEANGKGKKHFLILIGSNAIHCYFAVISQLNGSHHVSPQTTRSYFVSPVWIGVDRICV